LNIKAATNPIRFGGLLGNSIWMFSGQVVSALFQAVYFILLGRLLGSTEYGIFMGATALASILSQYSTLGSNWVFIRYVSHDPENFSRYWGNILIATLSLGAIFTAVLATGGPYFAHSYSRLLLVCIGLGDCLFMQLAVATGFVFQAFEKMRLTAVVNVITNMMRAAATAILALHFHRVNAREWSVVACLVSMAAAIVAVGMVSRNYGRPKFSLSLLKARSGEGMTFAFSNSAGNVYNDFDKVLMGHYGMNAANGTYSMAYKVINLCSMPISAIYGAAIPRIFRKGKEGVLGTGPFVFRLLKRTALLSLGMAGVMWLLAPVLPRLLGPSFADSTTQLRWLCLLPFFRSFQWGANSALAGAGYQKLCLRAQIVTAVFNLGTNLYMIPKYGWFGAVLTSVASDALVGVLISITFLYVRSTEQYAAS
jgi:O-antigen/teichoic acid export membrane protein